MTAAVLRSSPNLAVPQTQNTAPVHEFNCLYTHDLRRKQKRWQDGFLRYHTFNKRVMVYDVPRNFLGDLHWTSGDDLQEGDEMTLEKSGIIVQVSERIGTIQTDLSNLLQRKDKTPVKNPASSRTLVRHGPTYAAASSVTPRTPHAVSTTPMKHKSLNALLGRSRRPIGKASLPTESPYEARIRDLQAAEGQDSREHKRQRLDSPGQTTPVAAKRRDGALAHQQTNHASHTNTGCEVIDISSDTEDISVAQAASRAIDAELLATSSPARLLESPAHRQTTSCHFRPTDRQPPAAKSAVVESPSARASDRPRHADAPASDTALSRKETGDSRESKDKGPRLVAEKPSRRELPAAESDPQMRGRSLKLVGGAPRKMLLFQSQNSRPSSSETGTEGALCGKVQNPEQETSLGPARESIHKAVVHTAGQPALEQDPEDSIFQRRMQERLARIEKKKKKSVLQRSSSDVTEQRPVVEKTANGTGLRKTTSAVMSRLDSPEDPSLADFQFADVTPLDFDDPIIDDSVAQPPTRPGRETVEKTTRPTARGASTISARSFKPLTVKAGPVSAPVPTTKMAQTLAVEQKKNEDIGPWSKEAFDLMDWRPPNMQAKTSETK
ncbi:hypothetical protein QM012_000334 [Aureobasidium pullulans]|uniref:5'-3' DNA helicase ZGRF1-like N-terminal domain-containing protein n=1 Tax=Aureobasidium pullulans TaxID=5580 RepID=A0ABR0TVB4_AURPU